MDGVNVGFSSSMHYACTISASSVSEGSYSLKAAASGKNCYSETKEYNLAKMLTELLKQLPDKRFAKVMLKLYRGGLRPSFVHFTEKRGIFVGKEGIS